MSRVFVIPVGLTTEADMYLKMEERKIQGRRGGFEGSLFFAARLR